MGEKQFWNSIYTDRGMTLWSPPEATVQFVGRFLRKRLDTGRFQDLFPARRILDLGCGNGAAALFLAKMGYETYGIDISESAVTIGRKWLADEVIPADLRAGDVSEPLPYPDGHFDAVTCYAVLDHVPMEGALRAVSEVHRVLASPGLFFLTLAGAGSKKFGEGRKVGRNTFKLEDDYEAGAIQHYFDRQDIETLLAGRFRIKDIREVVQKKFDLSFRKEHWSNRWHLTVEKT